jgi:hypothetical protein
LGGVTLFKSCIVCNHPFVANEELEHFPVATRIAFDPERGRLWAICSSCRRWTLAPIEQRWEALDELEKAVRDYGRLLSQTDNVALLRVGKLQVVRVGRADLTEEAWWRYGRELVERKTKYNKLTFVGTVAAGAAIAGGWASGGIGWLGAWFLWENAPGRVADAARWLRFGSAAWRGRDACAGCGHRFRTLHFRDRTRFILTPNEGRSMGMVVRCPVCGEYRDGGLHLSGREGEHVVRRVLAYHHFEGASERRVKSATRLIQEAGTPHDLTRIVIRDGRRLGELKRTGRFALEIAANESVEQQLLELELAELEAVWRQEEELAAIVDGELTPLPLLETLRRKATRIL